jgi:hypothetical protein
MEGKQVVRVGGGEARASKASRLALGVSTLQVDVLLVGASRFGLGKMRAGVQTPRAREEEALGGGCEGRKKADGGRTGTWRALSGEATRMRARETSARHKQAKRRRWRRRGKEGRPVWGAAVWGRAGLGYSVIGRTGGWEKRRKEEKGQSSVNRIEGLLSPLSALVTRQRPPHPLPSSGLPRRTVATSQLSVRVVAMQRVCAAASRRDRPRLSPAGIAQKRYNR